MRQSHRDYHESSLGSEVTAESHRGSLCFSFYTLSLDAKCICKTDAVYLYIMYSKPTVISALRDYLRDFLVT